MPTINLGRKPRRPDTVKLQYQHIYQDTRWKRLRAIKFAEAPLCEHCLREGRVTQTEEVHHIVPFDVKASVDEQERLAFDYDNLVSLCVPCHKKAHDDLK